MKIRLRENGPVAIDLPAGAKFRLNGEERTLERPKLALCRCGHSERKPFCDATHKKIGFEAKGGEIEVF
ncbi:MAG: iron-binding protein [Meiothermus sp.]